MTDKEIIKALENCLCICNCEYCPFFDIDSRRCSTILFESVIDLINRQQAEIERLESIINTDNQMIKSLNKCYEISKTEAIKEFAERLVEYIEYRYNENCDFVPYVRLSEIEKVVYEMVGVGNESKCE